jgi:hypothetical protein
VSEAGQAEANTGKTLDQLKRMFDDSREGMEDTRKLSEACRDYFDGKQLTAAQRRVLRLRKQPDVVVNRTKRAVLGILGVVEQGKTDPRAYMRNPPKPPAQPQAPQMGQPAPGQPVMGGNGGPPLEEPDLDAGDVATMTLRYVGDTNEFEALSMDALENMLIEGYGGAIIEFLNDDVSITLIPSEEYFYDTKSRKADFSDKRYDGIAKWMYADDVAAIYPEKAAEIENTVTNGDAGRAAFEGWDDKPDKQGQRPWVDKKSRRLMVVEMYYKEAGIWNHTVFHAGGKLDECAPSIYLDDKGNPVNPIETQALYVARDLTRYGEVKDMIDIQDEINARRSKAIHEINTRQIQKTDPNAPPVNVDEARKEAARPDGVIPTGYQVVPRQDVVANSVEMLNEAKAELERLAPNPAILGRQGADASGRAQQIRQQAGMVELARPLGRFTGWKKRVHKQAWSRCRQFYDAPKWIRVTGDDGAPQYVQINEPTPPQIDPMTGQLVQGPPKNHVAKMDVDIVVDSVPDTATLEQEIFNEFVEIAKVYGPTVVPLEVLLEMSPLPKRRDVIKRLEKAQAKAAQNNAPANQLKAAEVQAGINKDNSQADLNKAKTDLTQVQTTVEAMEGHLTALSASQMPQGHTLDANDQHVPLQAPPPGANLPGANAGTPPV